MLFGWSMSKSYVAWIAGILLIIAAGVATSAVLGYDAVHDLPSFTIILLGLLTRRAWQISALAILATAMILIDPNIQHSTGTLADIFEHSLSVMTVWIVALLIHHIQTGKLQIKTTEKRQLRVLDAAMDAIISINDEGRVTYFNESAETMFGLPKKKVIDHDLTEIIIPERYRPKHRLGLERALNNTGGELTRTRVELSALRADGSEFPIELTITENRGGPQRLTAFIRDLTELKLSEREMKLARDEAIAANNAKARFLDNMSRDLRTPLTTILGYTHMAIFGDKSVGREKVQEYLGNIRNAGETLQDTVDRLLAISHAGSIIANDDGGQQHLFDLTPDMICICRDGRVATINQAGVDMIGAVDSEAAIGRLFTDFIEPEDRPQFDPLNRRVRDESMRFNVRIPHTSGKNCWVEIAELDIEFENQAATMMVGRDVTSEMRTKRESSQQRNLLSILHETAVVANNASSPEEAIGLVLQVVCTHTGWPVGHAFLLDPDNANIMCSSRIWHCDDDVMYRELREVTEQSRFGPGEGMPGRIMVETAPVWIADINEDLNFPRAGFLKKTDIRSVFAFPVLIGEKVVGVLEFFSPENICPEEMLFNALNHIGTQLGRVIEREKAETLLIRQANFEPLTNLPNRALAMDRLTQAIQLAQRDDQAVIVISVDLDDFKKVNDSLGHVAGDHIIIESARRLESSLRKSDTVASLGGDEFLVIIKEIKTSGRAAMLAEKLLAILRDPFLIESTEVFVSASLGVSVFPEDGDDAQALLRQTDIAMFSAKTAGRDTYRFFSPDMNADSQNLLTMDTQLRYALDAGELFPVYQPIVDTVTGNPIALETLLRWDNPELGFVRPDQFIPVAESSGEIIRIGSWLINQACQDLVALKRQNLPELRIAINISPKQFMRGTILSDVRNALENTGLQPKDLELEVTEGLLMIDTPEIMETLNELHAMGIGLSIDDFGTGYSSLSYLQRYPFDTLKIDKSFVDGLSENSENAALVAGIISMSHAMGMKVICEGVETAQEHAFLERHDGDFIQGYYFGKPASLSEAAATLQHLNADDLLLKA
jgi:diguanylate cyclase (GGDEF)-like protein/PAS domain S-box-containing protein